MQYEQNEDSDLTILKDMVDDRFYIITDKGDDEEDQNEEISGISWSSSHVQLKTVSSSSFKEKGKWTQRPGWDWQHPLVAATR